MNLSFHFLKRGVDDLNMETSCGAIVYTRQEEKILFVLVQEKSGSYSFPKGHMEDNETELETARREIFEETGLRPKFRDGFYETDTYDLKEKPGTRKRVVYFLAEFENEKMVPMQGEIRKIVLLPYEQAIQCFEYEGSRRVLKAAYSFLTGQ